MFKMYSLFSAVTISHIEIFLFAIIFLECYDVSIIVGERRDVHCSQPSRYVVSANALNLHDLNASRVRRP